MYREIFIRDMSQLGIRVSNELKNSPVLSSLNSVIESAYRDNPYFTPEMQRFALNSISNKMLQERLLRGWLQKYDHHKPEKDLLAGIIMAGNIPAVGFHDLLAGLAAGFKCDVKLSKKDKYIIPYLVRLLIEINPFWKEKIHFKESLSLEIDALLASGSDNTMKIIGESFTGIPSLLRGTRSSIGIISGYETLNDIDSLCDDIFLYYGMGCRSVTKLFVPQGYDLSMFLKSSQRYAGLTNNHDYSSLYRYHKATLSMSGEEFTDGGFFLISTNCTFPPPLSVISLEYYKAYSQIENFIELNKDKIQIVESLEGYDFLRPGESQVPGPDDYADGSDTVEFLLSVAQK